MSEIQLSEAINEEGVSTEKETQVEVVKHNLKEKLIRRFGPEGEQPLEYHNPEHSLDTEAKFIELATGLQEIDPNLISDRDIEVGSICALGHDSIQRASKISPDGFETRVRARGIEYDKANPNNEINLLEGNEINSARDTYAELIEAGITDITFEEVVEYMAATYPEVDFKDGLRIWQPKIKEDTKASVLLLGMSDLMRSCGTEEFDKYYAGSWAEFQELNEGIKDYVANSEVKEMQIEKRYYIAQKALGWALTQPSFVKWQKVYFEGHLDGVETVDAVGQEIKVDKNLAINNSPKAAELKQFLRSTFTKFDENAAECVDAVQTLFKTLTGREAEEFEEIYRDFFTPTSRPEINKQILSNIADDATFEQVLRFAHLK